MTRAVPFPFLFEETKIQPSLERVSVNDLLDSEIEDTSSNSETRLLSFLSPEDTVLASSAAARPLRKTSIEAISLGLMTRA
jgi:hypothetical protein